MAGDTLSTDRVTTKVELEFPTVQASLADVALSLVAHRSIASGLSLPGSATPDQNASRRHGLAFRTSEAPSFGGCALRWGLCLAPDRALDRSNGMKVIEAKPVPQVSAAEMNAPFATLRRRA